MTPLETFARILVGLVLVLNCGWVRAEAIDVARLATGELGGLGQHADVFSEGQTSLDLDAARALFRDGRFTPGKRPVLNLGLGAQPVWARITLFNPGDVSKNFYATLGATWIDRLDVYLVSADGVATPLHAGDALPGAVGVVPGIGTGFALRLSPGYTELYVRAQTPDPMLLPITLVPQHQLAVQERGVHYFYGALYGFLLALIVYNCMLFFALHRRNHLYYALYVLCFIVMNACYTGHGFAYFWPDHPDFQRFVIVASILIYAASGLLFAISFLELEQHAARLYRWVRGLALAGLLAMAACIALNSQFAAVLLAFSYLSAVTAIMVGLGVYAVITKRNAGGYFLAATFFGMLGAAATTTSVWGAIPYNAFTYHGIELGIVMEATLFALALARQVRFEQAALAQAEYFAQHDPLTGLHNRRAFIKLSQAAWAHSQRNFRPMCVLMLDIDHFKQINDRFGHEGGDKLLIAVSRLLQKTCRAGDLLARWGGEEFVLILPETEIDQARLFAERVRQLIEELGLGALEDSIPCTASIGVAAYSGDRNLEALIARADVRLYEAKTAGRNKVCG